MKEKVILIAAVMLILLVLLGLNAASYSNRQEKPDTEFQPKRSTYNAGSTGTKALYELLTASGISTRPGT